MANVYCLGNKYVSEDNLALRFVDQKINNLEFKAFSRRVILLPTVAASIFNEIDAADKLPDRATSINIL